MWEYLKNYCWKYPPGNDHISHQMGKGKSSTQIYLGWGYVSSQENRWLESVFLPIFYLEGTAATGEPSLKGGELQANNSARWWWIKVFFSELESICDYFWLDSCLDIYISIQSNVCICVFKPNDISVTFISISASPLGIPWIYRKFLSPRLSLAGAGAIFAHFIHGNLRVVYPPMPRLITP